MTLEAQIDARAAELAEQIAELRAEVSRLATERPPALLDRRGLARELSVSAATVDRLRAEGLPTIWVVESPRFELVRVLDWLRGRDASPSTVRSTRGAA